MSIVDKSPNFVRFTKHLIFSTVAVLSVSTVTAQKPLTLKECIEYGLKNHPIVAVANNNVENAKQTSREALGAYLPQVNVNGEFDQNLKLQTNIIPASPPLFPKETRLTFGNKFSSTAVAQAEQVIFNQSLITGIKANKPNEQIARLNVSQTKETLIYDISSSYFQVITIYKQLQLLNGNKERTEKLLKIAQLQAKAGVAKQVDVKQVQVSLNNVLAQLSVAENNLQLAYNGLKNSMGVYTNDSLVLTDTARWLNNSTVNTMAYAVTEFKPSSTISFRLQEKQIELYDLNAKSIRMRNIPVVSGFARYGFNGFGAQAGEVFERQFDYSTIGLKVSVNLFDGFKRNAQYKQAVVQRENAKLNLQINQAGESLKYQNAVSRFKQAQTTLSTNNENVELAGQVYDIVGLQYKEGTGTLSDLLNAESSYRDAQNNYIQSLISYYIAQLDLEEANSSLEEYYNKL